MTYEHTINILPAYDKRSSGHGIHGCDMIFNCKKDNKGISFLLFTNWHLPSVDRSSWSRNTLDPDGAFVEYHDTVPHYEDHHGRENCTVTGGVCYSDGSGLLAVEFFEHLVRYGYDGLKKKMEEQYVKWIKGATE